MGSLLVSTLSPPKKIVTKGGHLSLSISYSSGVCTSCVSTHTTTHTTLLHLAVQYYTPQSLLPSQPSLDTAYPKSFTTTFLYPVAAGSGRPSSLITLSVRTRRSGRSSEIPSVPYPSPSPSSFPGDEAATCLLSTPGNYLFNSQRVSSRLIFLFFRTPPTPLFLGTETLALFLRLRQPPPLRILFPSSLPNFFRRKQANKTTRANTYTPLIQTVLLS